MLDLFYDNNDDDDVYNASLAAARLLLQLLLLLLLLLLGACVSCVTREWSVTARIHSGSPDTAHHSLLSACSLSSGGSVVTPRTARIVVDE